jgi:hypothetical protein
MRSKSSLAPLSVNRLSAVGLALLLAMQSAVAAAKENPTDFSGVWFSEQWLNRQSDSAKDGPDALFREENTEGNDPLEFPGGEPKLREPYRDAFEKMKAKTPEDYEGSKLQADSSIQCLPDGMPRMMRGILPIEIVQTPKKLIIITEELSQVRRIFLDKLPPMNEIIPSYAGYSAGHWEGAKLIVTTVSIRPDVLFAGIPHSEESRITETLSLLDKDRLEIKFKYEDNKVLTSPYEFTWTYTRHDDHKVAEYVCDNNKYTTLPDGSVEFNIE